MPSLLLYFIEKQATLDAQPARVATDLIIFPDVDGVSNPTNRRATHNRLDWQTARVVTRNYCYDCTYILIRV